MTLSDEGLTRITPIRMLVWMEWLKKNWPELLDVHYQCVVPGQSGVFGKSVWSYGRVLMGY